MTYGTRRVRKHTANNTPQNAQKRPAKGRGRPNGKLIPKTTHARYWVNLGGSDVSNLIQMMFDNGVFEIKHNGIIEIYPRKTMNTFTLDAALAELSKTHDIVKMFPDRLRAFEKRG